MGWGVGVNMYIHVNYQLKPLRTYVARGVMMWEGCGGVDMFQQLTHLRMLPVNTGYRGEIICVGVVKASIGL